jgi:hypothetical protein
MGEEGRIKRTTPAVKFKDETFISAYAYHSWYLSYITATVSCCLFSQVECLVHHTGTTPL